MNLSHGRTYLAIPGPSVMPDRVLRAMQRPAPNIYEGELVEMAHGLIPDLKRIAGTKERVAPYIANGHGIWEIALANVTSRGDKVLAASTGRFCEGWAEMARDMGLQVEMLDFGYSDAVDPARVADALRADKAHEIRAVLVVQVDTSTGVRNDIQALAEAMKATGHPALLMVDAMASMGCERFEMDAWGVDICVAGSQKGLMTPPGLGFVWFNARADEARGRADLVTRYSDWRSRAEPEALWQYYGGTPPTHLLYALREALDMMLEEGIADVWARHAKLAEVLWAAGETWGRDGPLRFNIADRVQRSHSVTTLHIDQGRAAQLRAFCQDKAGVTLGIGLAFNPPEDTFRIGHMGHVNAHMVLGVLGVIEAGMIALDIPHGAGGMHAAAEVVARA